MEGPGMLFEYRYLGTSAIDSSAATTALSFAPDTSREPTFFQGTLGRGVPFREAISALHAVVVSDLRFKPKDRAEYLAWAARQEALDLAELVGRQTQNRQEIAQLRAELAAVQRELSRRTGPFHRARKRYFNYLYRKAMDTWYVLDPVITVHPDALLLECFSEDESSYGLLSCDYEIFDDVGEFACGTTNIDYSQALYNEFQKIRDYKETSLTVDPAGFSVQTTAEHEYREVKIDLPDSWVRGFLQVSSAMTLPGVRLSLDPTDLQNFCTVLRRRREQRGPRAIRFQLIPGSPIRAVFEPWGLVIDCPRSPYTGTDTREIRVWGRRRLHLLERLLPLTRRVDVTLLGSGMPSFWVLDLGNMRFTLGLSGWTANDWSSQGNFDLLAPRAEVDNITADAIFAHLKRSWVGRPEALADELGVDADVVWAALGKFTQAGRAMYDLSQGVYRARELSRAALPLERLRWSNEREAAASELVAAGGADAVTADERPDGGISLQGLIRDGTRRLTPSMVIDEDQRMISGDCSCRFHITHRLRRGPCTHLLALRLAHARRSRAS